METFSQIDDHILTLIKHSQHPQMAKAKQIIDQIEHRSKTLFCRAQEKRKYLKLLIDNRYLSLHRQYAHFINCQYQ